jgi:hypothetical protein
MPLFALVACVIVQVLFLHGFGRLFLKRDADTHWGLATIVGVACFITFHQRDGLPTWPAAPLLIGVGLVTYYLSIKIHRRFNPV